MRGGITTGASGRKGREDEVLCEAKARADLSAETYSCSTSSTRIKRNAVLARHRARVVATRCEVRAKSRRLAPPTVGPTSSHLRPLGMIDPALA